MDNETALTFRMTAYAVMENYKHFMFFLFLLLYLVIIFMNVLLIRVVHRNKELHLPMNMFPCILSINDIFGVSALLPAALALLMSESHEVPVMWCIAQVYFLHTYASAELCLLALMGYDRYVAICHPLHYHVIMSHSKVVKLTAAAVIYPLVVFGSLFSLTVRLRFCGRVIPKMYCVNMALVKNSCSTAPYISIVGLVFILFLVVPQILMILFSYAQITRVCRRLWRETKHSHLKTCIPHLLSLFNYTIGALFEIVQARFDMNHVPEECRIFLSLYFLIMTPIVNPVLYGLGTQMIRVHMMKLVTQVMISTVVKLKLFSNRSL